MNYQMSKSKNCNQLLFIGPGELKTRLRVESVRDRFLIIESVIEPKGITIWHSYKKFILRNHLNTVRYFDILLIHDINVCIN